MTVLLVVETISVWTTDSLNHIFDRCSGVGSNTRESLIGKTKFSDFVGIVSRDHLEKHIFSFISTSFGNESVFKSKLYTFDQFAIVIQWFAKSYSSLSTSSIWRDKEFK